MTKTKPSSWHWLLIFYFSLFTFHSAQAQPLSPSVQVSLITYGPGSDDISSAFGHTEIRIFDPVQGLDRNYSYGGFDYNADNFIVKFLRGTLPYRLSAHSLYQVLYYYQQNNRSVREQVLNLSLPQKQRLFAALEENNRPENREYRYRFYYDNCATRPRDMIAQACGDSLQFRAPQQPTKSYRAWMNDYLGEKPWAQLGMNLAIGRPADAMTSNWESMYLPNNVYDNLAAAVVKQPGGLTAPVVTRSATLFEAQKIFRKQVPFIFDPEVVFALLGIVVALFTARRYQRGRVDRWLDRLLFSVVGFWGWFLLLLWIGTDHGVTAWNPTLLWLAPFHLPLVFWATSRNTTARRRTAYFGITAVLILVGMVLSTVPGGVDVLFPLTLLIRCIVNLQPVRQRALMRTEVV
ncbi:DUF4105 domain-containing protein [Spirosoma montaniterrae]|uniref:Uncharacterized protein n=1 Tax=Spirosoma montaniterrae TaxID=1178516 RepID=A0A1P9WUN5_9BACT|nr:DUF4105 domain-containing protein [Spirosoma montaniterrae]AQG79069.1 hypothetical protein AWR27_06860 [Spirosoma montaniterrae]